MSKAILISIQPKWSELIANGKKTIEVRKTKPKLETPFKCYIYCTKNGKELIADHIGTTVDYIARNGGKVIGEFMCDCIRPEREVADGLVDIVLEMQSCMDYKRLIEYASGKVLYSWHISDLVIYDKPKCLSYFCSPCDKQPGCDCNYCKRHSGQKPITRPPQSWCYVEERDAP